MDPTLPQFLSLPHINGENIESGNGRLFDVKTVKEDEVKSGNYLFDAGDVLYSKLRPYLRKVAIAKERGLCSADMYPIKINAKILIPRFLKWLLLSDAFSNYADGESRRSRMPKLNRKQLLSWDARLPCLSDQRVIVEEIEGKFSKTGKLLGDLNEHFGLIMNIEPALLRKAFSGEL